MRPLLPALLPALLLASCAFAAASHPDFLAAQASPTPLKASTAPAKSVAELRDRLSARIAAQPGAEVGIWFRDLASGDTLAMNSDLSFHAASTMKVPVMIELFRRVDAGTLTLDRTLRLQNSFASIVDGSPYTLSASDDSDSLLYKKVGTDVSLRELNERMITRSSNLATNALIELLDPKVVNATAHTLGASRIDVRRGVEDNKAFQAGLSNTTTARDLGVLLAGIEAANVASKASCTAMKDVLMRQEFNDEIPAGLPAGTPVAHKTGWITGTLHDAAVVYPKTRAPYVLVVLTRKIPDEKVAGRLIAELSREVYAFATR
ncbi:MAG: class A beta-lactamase-related serine hydrolase [Gemmatimonadetes bacterium]|nr:class A beta-lactamase-related serine hydrolase [Gemmatimonadota bacterium]